MHLVLLPNQLFAFAVVVDLLGVAVVVVHVDNVVVDADVADVAVAHHVVVA